MYSNSIRNVILYKKKAELNALYDRVINLIKLVKN